MRAWSSCSQEAQRDQEGGKAAHRVLYLRLSRRPPRRHAVAYKAIASVIFADKSEGCLGSGKQRSPGSHTVPARWRLLEAHCPSPSFISLCSVPPAPAPSHGSLSLWSLQVPVLPHFLPGSQSLPESVCQVRLAAAKWLPSCCLRASQRPHRLEVVGATEMASLGGKGGAGGYQ